MSRLSDEFPAYVLSRIDSVCEDATERFCRGIDTLANQHDLSADDVRRIVSRRWGSDFADIYDEWSSEAS